MPVVEPRTGRVWSARTARRMGMVAGPRGGRGRYTPSPHLAPPPVPRELRTSRVWSRDRKFLDLNRPLPPTALSREHLRELDPGLFYAWNLKILRWEIWCRRPDDARDPYFVMRCVTHPEVKNEWGKVIAPCPYRPARARGLSECPPSCPGQYEVPDARVRAILGPCIIKSQEDLDRHADRMDATDRGVIEGREQLGAEMVQAMWLHNFNRIAGIKSVSLAGTDWA